ncbi:hypothetical protein GQ600_9870 [Phytophthora cactorum]|nr:hypothetical protein GQ600_9870 [Phytophthora cactorum]
MTYSSFEDDDDPPVTRDNSVAAPQDAAASDSEIERRFTATVIPLDVNIWSQSQNETEHLYQSSNTDKFRRRRRCQVAGQKVSLEELSSTSNPSLAQPATYPCGFASTEC